MNTPAAFTEPTITVGCQVLETLGDNRPGVVESIVDGLAIVRWPTGKRGTHSRDELQLVDDGGNGATPLTTRARRERRTTNDSFSAIRRYLPKFRDDEDAVPGGSDGDRANQRE